MARPEDRTLSLHLPGTPIAQGRPRLTTIGGRARAYDPKKSRDAKATLAQAMEAEIEDHPLYTVGELPFPEGPLEVLIVAVLPCPKGDYRKRNPARLRWRAKKPDAENLAKTVMDAATSVIWKDDSQVAKLTVHKLTAPQGGSSYTDVLIKPLNENVGDA